MNYRLEILRDVNTIYEEKGPRNYGLIHTLPRFVEAEPAYVAAVNQLLREGLILGVPERSDDSGDHRIAIALNPDRLADIRKELSPWHRDPKFVIPAIVGVIGLAWSVFKVFL